MENFETKFTMDMAKKLQVKPRIRAIKRQATDYEVNTFVDKYSQMDKSKQLCHTRKNQTYYCEQVIPRLKRGKAAAFRDRIVNPPVLKLNNLTLDKLKNKSSNII